MGAPAGILDRGGEAGLQALAAGWLAARPGERILDAGCGGGRLRERLPDGVRVAGLDLCPEQLLRALAAGLRGVRGDALRLPFRDGAFDGAACLLLLHYLPDPARALAELARVLRPGGRLVLADRVGSRDPVRRSAQELLERLRNPKVARLLPAPELDASLAAAGFRAERSGEVELDRDAFSWAGGKVGRLAEVLRDLEGVDLDGVRVSSGRLVFRVRLIQAVRS